MIGVVVWTDAAKSKAVIWCEDQKDLAYYRQVEEVSGVVSPCKGDLVEFEVHHEGSLRIAQNMLVIDVESHGDLADALRAEPRAGGETDSHVGADVTVLSRPESRDAKRMPGRKSIARQGKGYALALSGGDQESATILPFPERLRA